MWLHDYNNLSRFLEFPSVFIIVFLFCFLYDLPADKKNKNVSMHP